MKKLYGSILIAILIVLVGCQSPTDTDLEKRVDTLEQQVSELESILVDLQVIEGLNGQREYYLPQEQSTMFQGVSAYSVELLNNELDTTLAPTYVLDENDNYVEFEQLAKLLSIKYYGEDLVTSANMGSVVEIILDKPDLTQEEFVARTALMIVELSEYDFYIIGSSELVIQTNFNSTSRIILPIQTLRSSFITIDAISIINGIYEIRKQGLTYITDDVLAYYNDYITNETYNGYVLNME